MACGGPQPEVERKRAAKVPARFVLAHPHRIGQRTEVIIGHFRQYSAHGIILRFGGQISPRHSSALRRRSCWHSLPEGGEASTRDSELLRWWNLG